MKTHGLLLLCLLFSHINQAIPPRYIPDGLVNAFTQNGLIPVEDWYIDNSYPSTEPLVYNMNTFEIMIDHARAKGTNYYGPTDRYLYEALEKHVGSFNQKEVGIIGSTTPWYEAIVLTFNGTPITIDYNKIVSHHPQHKTLTVSEYESHPQKFDLILSISSIEHDGLGRYGDPINPDGDMLAMKKLAGMLKDDGILILAIPVGKDMLCWNAHRVYGKHRLPLLLQDWNIIDSFGFKPSDFNEETRGSHQPVFVLKQKFK